MTCTFFGHRDIFEDIGLRLCESIRSLIENSGVDKFYVGTHGSFDNLAFKTLERLSKEYNIDYKKVLASVPTKRLVWDKTDYALTVVPDGIEKAHPKYRIDYRNKWMIRNSEYVITYIKNPYGTGAAFYAELAAKKGKTIIKLGDY